MRTVRRRAVIEQPIGSDRPALPAGHHVIEVVPQPLHGTELVIIEGPRLPRWQPGSDPYRFRTVEEALNFDPARRFDPPQKEEK